MKKIISIIIVLFVFLISGCSQAAQRETCQSPYIEYQLGNCCLDQNNNRICDNDEKTNEELKVVKEIEAIPKPIEKLKDRELLAPENTPSAPKQVKEETPQENVSETTPIKDWEVLYEFSNRNYYYQNNQIGVQASTTQDYEGSLPLMGDGKRLNIRVFNIILTPKKKIDILINYDTDEFEATDLMEEGDTYVTRDGIKITIHKIYDNRFEFSLEKVPESEHKELCPECIRNPDKRESSGVWYINLHQKGWLMYKGKYYDFSIHSLNRETNTAQLQVNSETLPFLKSYQNFILKDGVGIKYLYAAKHEWGGMDDYGYIAFGFINTLALPNKVICPDCTDFAYLYEGEEQKIRINRIMRTLSVKKKNDKTILSYDDFQTEIRENESAKLNEDVSAVLLLQNQSQYLIGLINRKGVESKVYCKEYEDENFDYAKAGWIEVHVGSKDDEFERKDICLDNNTLIEYACEKVPDRDSDRSSGEGYTGKMVYKTCNCNKGACQ